MLLLELREVLNRVGIYGQWIDSNTGEVYPVKDEYDHEAVAKKIIQNSNYEPGHPRHNIYQNAFKI